MIIINNIDYSCRIIKIINLLEYYYLFKTFLIVNFQPTNKPYSSVKLILNTIKNMKIIVRIK